MYEVRKNDLSSQPPLALLLLRTITRILRMHNNDHHRTHEKEWRKGNLSDSGIFKLFASWYIIGKGCCWFILHYQFSLLKQTVHGKQNFVEKGLQFCLKILDSSVNCEMCYGFFIIHNASFGVQRARAACSLSYLTNETTVWPTPSLVAIVEWCHLFSRKRDA